MYYDLRHIADKPFHVPRLNHNHPLTRDLVFAGPFGPHQNLAIGPGGRDLGTATVRSERSVISTDRGGLGVTNADGDGGGQWWQSERVIRGDGAATAIALCKCPSEAAIRRVVTQLDFETTFAHFSLALNSNNAGNSATGTFAIIMDDGTDKTSAVSSGGGTIDDAWHWYGGTVFPGTANSTLYHDGIAPSLGTALSADPSGWWNNTAADYDVCVGTHGRTFTQSFNGEVFIAFMWHRALTAFEHLQVTRNWRDMFLPDSYFVPNEPAAGGGGLAIPIAQAHARRRR